MPARSPSHPHRISERVSFSADSPEGIPQSPSPQALQISPIQNQGSKHLNTTTLPPTKNQPHERQAAQATQPSISSNTDNQGSLFQHQPRGLSALLPEAANLAELGCHQLLSTGQAGLGPPPGSLRYEALPPMQAPAAFPGPPQHRPVDPAILSKPLPHQPGNTRAPDT